MELDKALKLREREIRRNEDCVKNLCWAYEKNSYDCHQVYTDVVLSKICDIFYRLATVSMLYGSFFLPKISLKLKYKLNLEVLG